MEKVTVLLAEDELALAHIVRENLEERDYHVILCHNGEQAMQHYLKAKPAILVLDIMMPIMDGITLAKKIRINDKHTPIIFLTAKSQPKDVVAGFETGANDYLKKPFSIEELIVRIQVQLSKGGILTLKQTPKTEVYPINDFEFHSLKNIIKYGIDTIQLTSRESEILKLLCENGQQIVERKLLLDKLWGNNNFFNARSLDVFISKLRKHLLPDPAVQIINVRGVGYKLVY